MGHTRVNGLRVSAAVAAVLGWLGCVTISAVVDQRLSGLGRPDLEQLQGVGVIFLFAEASAVLVGALLILRLPLHPVGWCFAALGLLVAATGASQSYGVLGLIADPGGAHPGAGAAAVLASSLFVFWLVALALICYLTPTGHPLSARWGRCARLMCAAGVLWFLTILFDPSELQAPFRGMPNPWGVTALEAPLGMLRVLSALTNNLLVLVAFASLVVRFRRSVGEERRQLLWMGLIAVPVPVLVAAAFVASSTHQDDVLNLTAGGFVAVLPLAVGLAVAKTRLYDVDLLLSRAASYVLLSALLAGTYAAVALVVGQFLGDAAGSSTIATSLATLAAATAGRAAYRPLQDALDRRFSRRRYEALSLVRQHIAAPDPSSSIEQVLRVALQDPALSVSYWVEDRQSWVSGDGRPDRPAPASVAVHRSGRTIARVSAPAAEPELAAAILHEAEPELDNAGLRAAVALQLEDVRASRERLAAAQLEERRRVERDLHDGAQQRLLALAAQLQAALLNGHPERLREALVTGVEQSQVAVRELRELANGLHPSVLADGGLTAALHDLASRHPIQLLVQEPDRRYAAQVEATAWFIACEAVSNAVKHAGGETIQLELAEQGTALTVVINDAGPGGADAGGGGLRGIADRAEAIGGSLTVLPRQPRGTTVRAVLPCVL